VRGWGAALLLVLLLASPALAAESGGISLSDIEKEIAGAAAKPYSLGGFLEFEPTLFGLDREAAFRRIRQFEKGEGGTMEQYDFGLRLEGSYRKDNLSAFFRADGQLRRVQDGWTHSTTLMEGYASLKPHPSLVLDAGKKAVKWGKGYAWNPASFIDRPKNPEDPEEALEGFTLASADYVKSLPGPLKTVGLTGVLLPVHEDVNGDFGVTGHLNGAAKLYLLLYDTDIDFMFFGGGSRSNRYGFDFSRNITPNFEAHGEAALVTDAERRSIGPSGRITIRETDAVSWLLGVRYLTEKETTWIAEYYHNGAGFKRDDLKGFLDFADNSYEGFRRTGSKAALFRTSELANGPFGRPNSMRDYFYLRASQKEPFDILYLTPALTSIVNLQDGSLNVLPEIVYSPKQNLELRLRAGFLAGGKDSEFGEKQNDYRVEFRVRYFFQLP